jgi:hypothetical protein
MNIREIHKVFVSYWFPLVITVIVLVALRYFDGFFDVPRWNLEPIFLWTSTLLQIGIAVFLLFLSQSFGIIRRKSLLPAFFYLLLAGTTPIEWDILWSIGSAVVVALCLLYLFLSYQKLESQRYAFNISLLLTLGSFLWEPILLFLPLLWYGMYRFRSLNGKSLVASLLGFVVIYLFIFTYCFYQDNLPDFVDALPTVRGIFDPVQLPNFNVAEWIHAGFIFLLFILSGMKIFMASVSETIQAITTLGYLYVFALVLFLCYFFIPAWESEVLQILYLPLSLLFAHYFTMAQKTWILWLFLFSIVFFVTLYAIF